MMMKIITLHLSRNIVSDFQEPYKSNALQYMIANMKQVRILT
jgi:hypothetical protein